MRHEHDSRNPYAQLVGVIFCVSNPLCHLHSRDVRNYSPGQSAEGDADDAMTGVTHQRRQSVSDPRPPSTFWPIDTPTLAGQDREYMAAQLEAYASGARKNDVYGRMRDIARKLTPEERQQLARYFQGTM